MEFYVCVLQFVTQIHPTWENLVNTCTQILNQYKITTLVQLIIHSPSNIIRTTALNVTEVLGLDFNLYKNIKLHIGAKKFY